MKPIRTILPEPRSCIVSKREWFAYVVTAIIAGLVIVTLIALVV